MGIQILLVVFIATILATTVQAQQTEKVKKDYSKFQNWHFRVSPFLWYLGIKGEIIQPPQPSTLPEAPPSYEIDVGFKEIRNSLKFFIMIGAEYRGKHIVAQANVTSFILEGQAVTPFEIIIQGVNYRLSYLSSEITAGYRILKMKKINLDGLLGLRFINTNISASTNILGITFSGERNVFWYDPIMAFKVKYIPHPKLELSGYVDFGPIRAIDSYQITASVNYLFTKVFHMSLGYRNYFIDSEPDEEDTFFKGRVYGPYLRFGFQF